jgi:magnesium transporter
MLLVTSSTQAWAEEMRRALREDDIVRAITLAHRLSPASSARILADAPPAAMQRVLTTIGWAPAARIVAKFPAPFAATLVRDLTPDAAAALLQSLPVQAAAAILRCLPPAGASTLLGRLDDDLRAELETSMSHAARTAGAVMSPHFLVAAPDMTVEDVVARMRSAVPEVTPTSCIFVVHPGSRRMLGVVTPTELLLADPRLRLDRLMTVDVHAVRVDEPAREAVERIRSRQLKMLPVLDASDRIVGVIGAGDAMDLLAQELTRDLARVHALADVDSQDGTPLAAARSRLPWMTLALLLNLGAVAVIGAFDALLLQAVLVIALLPLILDLGGKVGTHVLTLVSRSIILGEARMGAARMLAARELVVGAGTGVAIGALFAMIAWLIAGHVALALAAGLALAANVAFAAVLGGTLPFLIRRIGGDPVAMSGPVLTTITDIVGIALYLGLATLLLGHIVAGAS